MSGRKCIKNSAGFTLLEVLIALVILVVGLLGALLLQTTAIQGNAFSRELQTGVVLAEDLLEQVRVLEYDDPLISSNVADNPHENVELAGVANPIDEQGASGGIYVRRWTVVDTKPNSKTISATVNWAIKGEAHSVTLTTVKSGDL
ncbi:MAG: prepilin-type N-terminal cleavage/methylation domain-containing protein [Deltaproteobacteria bacterium]|nr:prepilin-type N-terminal cleavage/methylation domain-containing protein [Deltaproteobacteria bacterium]NIS78212.1 prepilin-type N-terminal cleavage/methylation domain-containing protein [Deltaproteobacteria bacterium]